MARLQTLKPRVQMAGSSVRFAPSNVDSWRAGKTTGERGYGYRWQKARERFLSAHPLCCYCERNGHVTPATVVDHIKPHQGDQTLFWDEGNWQALCKPCHDIVKAKEEGRGRV